MAALHIGLCNGSGTVEHSVFNFKEEVMRALATCAVVLGLIVSPTMARAGGPGDKESANKASAANGSSAANATPAAAPTADPAGKAAPSSTEVESELHQMRDLLEAQAKQLQEQQQKMNQLEEQLKASGSARESLAAAPASPAAPAVSSSINATPADTAKSPQAKVEEKLSDLAYGKVKIGATVYGNFTHYTDTGYAPAFQDTPTTQLGPGNSGLNVFELTRAYINFFYTPSDHVTLRVTPDIYRSSDGSLAFRLKYGYVDFQQYFGEGAFKKTKLTFGQTQQPLTDWEEGLSGYRYAYLTPWNYLSLSSTYVGAKLHGPIEFNGKEYLDYDLGVFTTASFHSVETNDKKQVMGRLSFYPFGTTADRTGLGFTVFENYGYNTKPPSVVSTPLNRLSILAHYQTHDKAYQIAFEYQLGRNALSTGQLFGGAAPPASNPFSILAGTVLSGTHTRQQGFDFFGHARLGHTPFSVWGLYQYLQPNTNFGGGNPLDFARTVGGLSYKVTDHFDFAFGDQNFHWVNPSTGAPHGPDTNGIVIWTEYNY
jgi:hypothetical protein